MVRVGHYKIQLRMRKMNIILPKSSKIFCLLLCIAFSLRASPPAIATTLPSDIASQQSANEALRERITDLKAMIAGKTCQNTNRVRAMLGLQDLAPTQADTAALSPPAAQPSGMKATAVTRAQLVGTLQKAVVLVIAGSNTGSGFFVTPDTIITNHHVIEKSTTPKVIVVGRGTNGPRLARVAAKVTGKGAHARDYAILKVEGAPSSVILPLTAVVNELDSVVAAGFPGLLLDNDLNYRALAGGDMSALPDLALSQGSIMARQNRDRGLATLAHSAAISGGNSGGPLVDTCGRVVGINTFINVSVEQGTNAGFALPPPISCPT